MFRPDYDQLFVCSENNSSLAQSFNPDDVVMKQIEHMHGRVDQIDATKKPFQQLVQPCKVRYFDDSEILLHVVKNIHSSIIRVAPGLFTSQLLASQV